MAKAGQQTQIISWLLGRTRGVRLMWLLSVASRITNQLLMVAILVLAGKSIIAGAFGTYLWWIIGLSLVKAGLRYLEHYAGHWVAFTMLARLRTEFYDALVPQAPAVVKGKAAAELSERATRDIDRIEVFFAHTIPPAVAAIVVPVLSLLWVGFDLGWGFAAVIAAGAVLMTAVPAAGRLLSWKDNQDLASVNAQLATHLGDSAQGLREVLAFGASDQRLEQWSALEADADALRRKIRTRAGLRAGFLIAVELAVAVVLLSLASSATLVPAILAVLAWIGLWAALRGVDDFVDGLDEALASAERARRTINTPPLVTDQATETMGEAEPALSVDHVSFAYREGEPVLTDITTQIDSHTWNYVVGVSGSGKSTLAALLARGWDPGEGQITYRGHHLADLPLEELRLRVMLVVQRPYLLSDTLAANLRLSAPAAPESELWDALELVDMKQWAAALPGELEAPVATDGTNLSGGQIQRLAMARALVANPDVLILDEATSQLDEQTAAIVKQRVTAARPGLTVIEVSHQVGRIPREANVLVIDVGHLVEEGTAGELLERDGGYLQRLAAR